LMYITNFLIKKNVIDLLYINWYTLESNYFRVYVTMFGIH
jgi:hypothetical protein